jgi:hypothetical protein
MPTVTLPAQTGNSCAAHCTVVAVQELLTKPGLTKAFAEGNFWDTIKFKPSTTEGPITTELANKNNSDPRRIVSEIAKRWSGVTARMLFDDAQKTAALLNVPGAIPGLGVNYQLALAGLYGLLKGISGAVTIDPQNGKYYNCGYLMYNAGAPNVMAFSGMHNILVANQSNIIWYYNSNETTPTWRQTTGWKRLDNQNGGHHSYIFTGVCVEIARA